MAIPVPQPKKPALAALSPSTPSRFGSAGSYGEGAVVDRYNYLKQLNDQLKAGKMTAQQYLAEAQPLAEETLVKIAEVARKGSKAANIVNPFISRLKDVGFALDAQGKVLPQLGPDYEPTIRKSILPENTPEEQRKLIEQIPTDIPINSDRGQIERETTREIVQAKQGLDERGKLRQTALNDLAALLSKQSAQNFQESIPVIAEDANSAGIFRSSGYGEALARKKLELERDIANQIALKGISDRDLTVAGMGDITDLQIAGQQSGLQRQFSLDDAKRNLDATRQLAEASKPQPQGKSGGEKWLQGIQAGVGVGGLVAAPFTGGATLPTASYGMNSIRSVPTPSGANYSTGSPYVRTAPYGQTSGKAGRA